MGVHSWPLAFSINLKETGRPAPCGDCLMLDLSVTQPLRVLRAFQITYRLRLRSRTGGPDGRSARLLPPEVGSPCAPDSASLPSGGGWAWPALESTWYFQVTGEQQHFLYLSLKTKLLLYLEILRLQLLQDNQFLMWLLNNLTHRLLEMSWATFIFSVCMKNYL